MSGSNNEPSVSGKRSYSAGLFLGVQISPSPGLPILVIIPPPLLFCAEWRLADRWTF